MCIRDRNVPHHSPGPALCRRRSLSSNVRPCVPPAPHATRLVGRTFRLPMLFSRLPGMSVVPSQFAISRAPSGHPHMHARGVLASASCVHRAFHRLGFAASEGPAARTRPPRQGLTPRSSGAPTACHQAPATGTVYILCGRGLASHRWCRLTSNVRRCPTQSANYMPKQPNSHFAARAWRHACSRLHQSQARLCPAAETGELLWFASRSYASTTAVWDSHVHAQSPAIALRCSRAGSASALAQPGTGQAPWRAAPNSSERSR